MRVRAVVAFVALSAAPFAAQAADAPVVNPLDVAIANSAHDWAGAYVGINGGYAWGDFDTSAGDFSGEDALGGFQIGYNKQLGSVVIGVEGDVQASAIDGASGGTSTSLDWFSTARGRVGYAFDSTLLYGTAGLAVGGVEASTAGGSDDKTLVGIAAGAGIEQAMTDNLSLKAEYLYVDTENKTFDTGGTNTNAEWDGHVMRFGANLKF
jgi:outer membrane immunogenic protein